MLYLLLIIRVCIVSVCSKDRNKCFPLITLTSYGRIKYRGSFWLIYLWEGAVIFTLAPRFYWSLDEWTEITWWLYYTIVLITVFLSNMCLEHTFKFILLWCCTCCIGVPSSKSLLLISDEYLTTYINKMI